MAGAETVERAERDVDVGLFDECPRQAGAHPVLGGGLDGADEHRRSESGHSTRQPVSLLGLPRPVRRRLSLTGAAALIDFGSDGTVGQQLEEALAAPLDGLRGAPAPPDPGNQGIGGT